MPDANPNPPFVHNLFSEFGGLLSLSSSLKLGILLGYMYLIFFSNPLYTQGALSIWETESVLPQGNVLSPCL